MGNLPPMDHHIPMFVKLHLQRINVYPPSYITLTGHLPATIIGGHENPPIFHYPCNFIRWISLFTRDNLPNTNPPPELVNYQRNASSPMKTHKYPFTPVSYFTRDNINTRGTHQNPRISIYPCVHNAGSLQLPMLTSSARKHP